ncbi:MAG: hypothetical protein AB7F43_14690, partial [Bacteriovoracia bacterium]
KEGATPLSFSILWILPIKVIGGAPRKDHPPASPLKGGVKRPGKSQVFLLVLLVCPLINGAGFLCGAE